MIFADTSALVSIIAAASDGLNLAVTLQSHSDRLCSAMTVWETTSSLCNSYEFEVLPARQRLAEMVRIMRFRFVPIGERESELALAAYGKFGKGRHKAVLNMGLVSPMPAPRQSGRSCCSRAGILR